LAVTVFVVLLVGFNARGKCEGRIKIQEAIDELNKKNIGCPMLECAVQKNINICSRDCKKFPCKKFIDWPLSSEWLEMYKGRNGQRRQMQ
jgi:hypothetical protein